MTLVRSWVLIGLLVGLVSACVIGSYPEASPLEVSGGQAAEGELAQREAALSERRRKSLADYRVWRARLFRGDVVTPHDIGMIGVYNEQIAAADSKFERSLFSRVRLEQLGRLDWSRQPGRLVAIFKSRGLHLHPDDEDAVNEILMLEFVQADVDNTAWLKRQLAQRNDFWWKISEVGEFVSFNVFLLVQHADGDKAFQKKALSLMEPLVEAGEISTSNFAYLYDRVNDPQRYGTQLHCVDGAYAPRTLEDPDRVDEFRESVGLDPMAEYLRLPSLDPKNCSNFIGDSNDN